MKKIGGKIELGMTVYVKKKGTIKQYQVIEEETFAPLRENHSRQDRVAFTPRLTGDGIRGNQWWYSGLNPFYAASLDLQLPNCTTYAYGRLLEINHGINIGLPRNSAELWYELTTNLQHGQTPKLGAIICWNAQNIGGGHVAVVEQIHDNGDIVTSESSIGGARFETKMYRKSLGYNSEMLKFQGFIYANQVSSGELTLPLAQGSLDNVETDHIAGWVRATNDMTNSQYAHVYLTDDYGNKKGFEVYADEYRLGIGGNFGYSLGGNLFEGLQAGMVSVQLHLIDYNTNPLIAEEKILWSGQRLGSGSLDIVNNIYIAGWAKDNTDPQHSKQVHVYITDSAGNGKIFALDANQPRPDVGGNYGYSISDNYLEGLVPGNVFVKIYLIGLRGVSLLSCHKMKWKGLESIYGSIEVCNKNTISGWARDIYDTHYSKNIKIYLRDSQGNKKRYVVLANEYCLELEGNYQYTFTGDLTKGLSDGEIKIQVYLNGINNNNPLIGESRIYK